jgi:hypothetical protein
MALLSDFEPPRPAPAPEVARLAQVVFALLLLATVAAFFVTQKLKHEPSVVQQYRGPNSFSPLGSGHTVERISFKIKRADEVTVTVVNAGGDDVITLYGPRHLRAYHKLRLAWDGRLRNGRLAPDGRYHVRIRLRDQNRTVLVPRSFVLNTRPPQPEIAAITTATATTGQPGAAILPTPDGKPLTISFSPGTGHDPELFIYRTDVTPARLVEPLPIPPGATTVTWDGTVAGHRVPAGVYLVAIRDRDPQGNIGVNPATLPRSGTANTLASLPRGEIARGHAGITVRDLGVEPPVVATPATAPIAFGVDARRRGYSWSITRVGARHPRAQGRGSRPLLKLNAPGGISGVYELTVQTHTSTTRVPFAVQGPGSQRVLVVLPAITWLGLDAGDEDGDGFPDTLAAGLDVPRARIFAGGEPASFTDRLAPLLAFLDRHHLRYDVTTDLALAAHTGPAVRGHSGVVLAGDERWLPADVAATLRTFVRRGGQLASLGIGSLRHTVTLSAGALTAPTPTAPTDIFGARGLPLTNAATTLTNYLDQISLFGGGGGQFNATGGYEVIESVGLKSALVASAVTPDGHPVIAAVHYGRGTIIRTGIAGLTSQLGHDPAVDALIGRIWALLSQ